MFRYKQHKTGVVDTQNKRKENNFNTVIHLFAFIIYFLCNYINGPESQTKKYG